MSSANMNRSVMALQESEPAHIPGTLAPFCCDYVSSALRSRQGVQNIVRISRHFQSDQGFWAINLNHSTITLICGSSLVRSLFRIDSLSRKPLVHKSVSFILAFTHRCMRSQVLS